MSEQTIAVATSNCTAQISPAVRNKIIRALISGEYPVDADIAEVCKVPVSVVEKLLYQLSHKGSPRILEWVAYAFSSGSSRPTNRTGVSCIAGRFFTN